LGISRSPQERERWPLIAVGGRCNNHCIFCGVRGGEHVPLDRLMAQLARAHKGGARGFRLGEGELTTRKDLRMLLRFLKLSGLPWSLETNARLFTQHAWASAFAEAGLVHATVGLHGPRPVHDQVTGDASFEQTCAGIRNLQTSGIQVEARCVLTRLLVESTMPAEFAAVVRELPGVPFTLTPPPQCGRAGGTTTVAPDLGVLAPWLAGLNQVTPSVDHFPAPPRQSRRKPDTDNGESTLRVRQIPHCILPASLVPSEPDRQGPTMDQSPPLAKLRGPSPIAENRPLTDPSSVVRPCRTCARLPVCSGFESDTWPAGSIDFLVPDSETHPGHLVLRRHGGALRFDLADCPFKSGGRRLAPHKGETWMADGERRWSRWLAAAPFSNAVRLDTLVTWGQVWHLGSDGAPVPLAVAANCLSCHRLHECPACLVPVPLVRQVEKVEREPRDGSTLLAVPVREAWLLDRGATLPRRPFPVDPVHWVRERGGPGAPALLRQGCVAQAQHPSPGETAVTGYVLPTHQRRGPFAVELTSRPGADPLSTRPHRGMSLQVTESCMCRCIMCNIVGYFKVPMMPFPKILRIMTEAGLLGISMIDLFGGEVTLRKDLFALLEQVRWLGMDSMFITTGYYVDRAFAKRLAAAGVKRVVVSIDGSRPEIHDPIRQLPGLWDKAVRAMRALAAEPSIETFASTVILSQNLEDLPALIRLSARCGIRKHEFFLPISGPVSSTLPRWPVAEEAARFLDRILPEMEQTAAARGVSIDFRPEIRSWPMDREHKLDMISTGRYNVHQPAPDQSVKPRGKKKEKTPPSCETPLLCQAPGFNLFVTVNGNVYPCDMPALISRDTALGNLDQADLAGIVTGPRMREFVEQAGLHPACRMCVGRYEAVR